MGRVNGSLGSVGAAADRGAKIARVRDRGFRTQPGGSLHGPLDSASCGAELYPRLAPPSLAPASLGRFAAAPPGLRPKTRTARPSVGGPSLCDWRKTASPSAEPPAQLPGRRGAIHGLRSRGSLRCNSWAHAARLRADGSLGRTSQIWTVVRRSGASRRERDRLGSGNSWSPSNRGLANDDRRPTPRGRARLGQPALLLLLGGLLLRGLLLGSLLLCHSRITSSRASSARRDNLRSPRHSWRPPHARPGRLSHASPERRAQPHQRISIQRATKTSWCASGAASDCGHA